MLCLDNSDWARNGDYSPSRWEAQLNAANIICGAKVEQNPENSVGILTIAGKRIEVLTAPTTDQAKIYAAAASGKLGGDSDVYAAVRVAALALKHRQNKNQKARILLFVCSPVEDSAEKMTALGKELKKNNVAVDIISFGAVETHVNLEALQKAANSGDNSRFITIPSGPDVIIADVLFNTPILMGEGEAENPAAPHFPGGVNAEVDPELAEAMRLSMEEFKAQQAREEQAKQAAQLPPSGEPMAVVEEKPEEEAKSDQPKTDEGKAQPMEVEKPAEADENVFQDSEFVANLLASLPGVDPNDPSIKEALAQIGSTEEKKDEEKKKDPEPPAK